jgi:hypothetical protein
MQTFLQDLRYSLRQLVKNPGFTLTAVISLALGIGATTAVFSVIYAALMNPYPYPAADRIVRLTVQSKAGSSDWVNLNGPQVQQLRQLPVVESLLAMDYHAMVLTGHDLPENVNAIGLISNGFDDLGVPPVLGRGLSPSDAIDGQGPQPVTVLAYKFWQRQFFSDPDVLGRTLQLDRKNYVIVGVAAPLEILGQPAVEQQMGSINLVSPGYFSALRIPLLQGRIWNETENHNGAHVAVINQTLAQRYFPNGDALGHSVKLPGVEDRPPAILSEPNIADSWLPIVGIVEDARNDGLRNPIKPAVFVPYTLSMSVGTQILVRSEVPPLTLLHAVRAQLTAVDPDQQTYSIVEDLESWISDAPEWQQEHLAAWIFGVFAWLALALAAAGLYSVVSYTVAQRTNEFGIRMALGAQRGHVLRIVFATTLGSVGSGILAGLALTLAMNKILAKWTEGNSRDPIIFLAGTLLLSVISGIACAIPARRASEVDPMTALRCE